MLDAAWPMTVFLAAIAVPIGSVLAIISLCVRHGPHKRYMDQDVWASVILASVEQAEGIFPIGVVRVQNPDAAPVIVSVSLRPPRSPFGRWAGHRWGRRPLSIRSAKMSRQPRAPEGTILGAVSGGGVRVWELPLGRPGRLPVVRVRLDQAGPRTTVFAWALHGAPALDARTVAAPRRPALAE